ncbi:4'-phosphopantetheinyl transferase superfamily protein [Natronosporangium hydrolyticum]|uniref:4'-phosphopantetheinyl transferase superfamily protein n=1 Tax=Natronosporangium hydrolyticum TaxID=2811111 RepID=A0A895YFC8_9ACTN|nr:4'-phosphopantetheinyl transferase superfamily protein [Natronosporangium hydrolyticum]QSB16517.1 4'-phosphopantetheinyl transferase superfamily protein [Natronosporangium hydrolyticum]
MIAQLLPDPVVCAEAREDAPETSLWPGEAELVARAVPKRRREFTTARHCARRALAQLGVAPAAILTGERGAPRWPAGVVGSMTHCDGYRAAAVAHSAAVASVGIDAEPHGPLPEGVAGLVVRPEEATRLTELAAGDGSVAWDRLLFSAKESVYKVWYPLTGRWLDFQDASVTLRPDGGFSAQLLVPGLVVADRACSVLEGRWAVADGVLLTAIAIPAA